MMATTAPKAKTGTVQVEDGLLFILTELTNLSLPRIMAYFADRSSELLNCKSNVSHRKWDPTKHGYVTTILSTDNSKIVVLRGYFPNTPIAYKLTLYDDDRGWNARARAIPNTKQDTIATVDTIRDAVAKEDLLGDNMPTPHFARPRPLTPSGASPQHYRPKRSRRK